MTSDGLKQHFHPEFDQISKIAVFIGRFRYWNAPKRQNHRAGLAFITHSTPGPSANRITDFAEALQPLFGGSGCCVRIGEVPIQPVESKRVKSRTFAICAFADTISRCCEMQSADDGETTEAKQASSSGINRSKQRSDITEAIVKDIETNIVPAVFKEVFMAKTKLSAPRNDPARTGLMLRFDDDVYAGIKKLAEESDISVNQLMQGVARWAVKNGRSGEPYNDADGHLRERVQPGCVWFGRPASPPPDYETRQELAAHDGESNPEDMNYWTEGQLIYSLDFTERRVIQNDSNDAPVRPQKRPS